MKLTHLAILGALAAIAAFSILSDRTQANAPAGLSVVATDCLVRQEPSASGMRAVVRMAPGQVCTIDTGATLSGMQVHSEPGAGTLQVSDSTVIYSPSSGADGFDTFTLAGQLNALIAPGGARPFELVVMVEIDEPAKLLSHAPRAR